MILSGSVMFAVVGIFHLVLAAPTVRHVKETTLQPDGLRALVSQLEASLASKEAALQAIASSQSELAREFQTCSSEQVKLLLDQQTVDLELAKLEARYRQLEAEKLTSDKNSLLLKTDNNELIGKIEQLEHANRQLLAEKVRLENSLSSLHDEYLATLRDSEAVHEKLLRYIKHSKAVKRKMTKKLMTIKNQNQNLLKEKEITARKLIQAIKDIYCDDLAKSEPPAEEHPQDPLAIPENTQITEDTRQVEDEPKTYDQNQKTTQQDELHTVINKDSIVTVMSTEEIVNGNEIDQNKGRNDNGEKMEIERNYNTVIDLLQTHVDSPGTDNDEELEDSVDSDNDEREEEEVNSNDDNAAEWNENEYGEGDENNDNSNEAVNDNESVKCNEAVNGNKMVNDNEAPDGNEAVNDNEMVNDNEALDGNEAVNSNEAVNGNETERKYETDTREEFLAPLDKGKIIVDEQSNTEGFEYTDENSDKQELNDNETGRKEEENNEREKNKVEKDGYSTLVDLLLSLVDEASRGNKGLKNITDDDDKEVVKQNKTEPKGINEETVLQEGEDDYNEFILMDSQRSLIDEVDEMKNYDDEEYELNDEEKGKYAEESKEIIRDEM